MEITSAEELRALTGEADPVVYRKATAVLGPLEREWLAHSPLCLLATSAADGTCDVSRGGYPPGFALVLDEHTIALPDRPGNRRLDSWLNVLGNPHVGLLFLIPGRGDTLRVNGRAALVRDEPWFERMVVRDRRPRLALRVRVQEAYFHCAKAFLRGEVWRPETWAPDAASSRARIAKATEWTGKSMAELEERYGPQYEQRLY